MENTTAKQQVTIDTVRALLDYNHENGEFKWRNGRNNCGYINKGYRLIGINGKKYLAHRLAWAYHYGEWPEASIDHINTLRHDNRIANLRLATASQNAMNTSLKCNNSSGHKGVSLHKPSGLYHARIWVKGKQISLGSFKEIKEAIKARLDALNVYHGEFGRV